MKEPAAMQARNRRLALILVGVFAAMCLGAVLYIDWFHAAGPGAQISRAS